MKMRGGVRNRKKNYNTEKVKSIWRKRKKLVEGSNRPKSVLGRLHSVNRKRVTIRKKGNDRG